MTTLEKDKPQEKGAPRGGVPMVRARGVRKKFGHLEVLKGVDLDVDPGEVVVILGPSGSGKSTFLRCVNHLEQVNANQRFRPIAEFLAQVRYLHVVPQLIRETDRATKRQHDPFGSDFLEQLAKTPKRVLDSRLKKINSALRVAVPQMKELKLERDELGVPHLKGLYEHWRPNAGWQTEEHFSDGTLRLLGLLWALLDGNAPLLLEEPELSLHAAIVGYIPSMMTRTQRKSSRQVLVSTHSADLLTDPGIAPDEVVILEPSRDGTRVSLAADSQQVRALLEGGLSIAEAVLPRTNPRSIQQLALFSE